MFNMSHLKNIGKEWFDFKLYYPSNYTSGRVCFKKYYPKLHFQAHYTLRVILS